MKKTRILKELVHLFCRCIHLAFQICSLSLSLDRVHDSLAHGVPGLGYRGHTGKSVLVGGISLNLFIVSLDVIFRHGSCHTLIFPYRGPEGRHSLWSDVGGNIFACRIFEEFPCSFLVL